MMRANRLTPGAKLAIGTASVVTFFLAWELATRVGQISPKFLPPPSLVATALWTMLTEQQLAWHAGVSTLRVWTAFALASIMAIPIGIFMGSFRFIGAALEPLIDFIRYLPVPALVPLSIIWFGVGEETKIFLLWLGTFFQLVLLVADDVRRLPPEYQEIAATLGAPGWSRLWDVTLPAMLPTLVDNMRIALGWCWTYLIIAEIVAAKSGLGFVIWQARRYLKTPEVMAGVLVIGLIGLATDQLVRAIHRRRFSYLAG